MGKSKKRWLTNRRLFVLEALLAIGALETWAENELYARPDISDPVKVLITMALVIGMFSAVTAIIELHIQTVLKQAVKQTKSGSTKIKMPVPNWLIHVGIFIGLYFFYAWVNGVRALPQ